MYLKEELLQMRVNKFLAFLLVFATQQLLAHAAIDKECQYANSTGYYSASSGIAKSEDECRKSCESDPLCMVWGFLLYNNTCQLGYVSIKPKENSLFIMNNCKGGHPSVNAPVCEDQKGKLTGSIRAHPVTSLEECEKLCDVDCKAYNFFLDQNKPRCAIWTLKVVEDTLYTQIGFHYCNDKCKFANSNVYMGYPFIKVKTEDECRETCKNNPMCIVWQMQGNKCQLNVVSARPFTSIGLSFVINNCKRGKPTESAPNCKVNKGVRTFVVKPYRNQTEAGCEKICGNDCLMWQFSTSFRSCYIHYIYSKHNVSDTGNALFGINYCKEIPSTIQSTTGTCRCGVVNRLPTSLVNNIVGGTITSPHQYPWQVFIKGYNFLEKRYEPCGGTIISSKSILTAAHCMINHIDIKVWVGIHDIRNATIETGLKVCKKYHPQYNATTFDNDIAILILCDSDEIVFDQERVAPVCLPSSNTGEINNKIGVAIGWGKTLAQGPISNELREVSLYADDTPSCEHSFPGGYKILSDEICAYAYHKGACFGDSGGPLMMPIGFNDWNKPVFQAGVISHGKYEGCSSPTETNPTVFIRTIPHLKFIKDYMLGKVCT